MYGVAKSTQKQAAIVTLQEIMRMLPLTPLPGAAGAIYGEIRAELEAKGKSLAIMTCGSQRMRWPPDLFW